MCTDSHYSRGGHIELKTRIDTQTTMAAENIWSKNLENLPQITQAAVDNWANEEASIPGAKQQKGCSNFVEGYIHDVEGKKQTFCD